MAPITRLLLPIAISGITEVLAQPPPGTFEPYPSAGGGGDQFIDSPHFRVYGPVASDVANATLSQLEAAYACFVDTLGWRSSGLSYNDDSDAGPWYKTNVYSKTSIDGGAAGVMGSDPESGLGYLDVVDTYLTEPGVVVHEYGHVLTYHAQTWVDQTMTGAWWEPVAQFVADTYQTSPICESARAQYGQAEGETMIELEKVIGDSFQVIVDGSVNTGNYYQAWPFLTYLTNNPDEIPGLGQDIVGDLLTGYEVGSNETPLHVLERLVPDTPVQQIIGRYWARMAYLDIANPKAQELFFSTRDSLNFVNLQSSSDGSYQVIPDRQPRYMGANIVPLDGEGQVTVSITANAAYTATLAVYAEGGAARYVDVVDGSAEVTLAGGEEASLVVVNTPDTLYAYDPFALTDEVEQGLDYSVQIQGATVPDV
ncbi:hypothetical protein FQN54_001077 [Arachnomyces sp. PD_36]|nr:hypothetical protein FQN54_001077 [Arachnomyces sp. PD_36]